MQTLLEPREHIKIPYEIHQKARKMGKEAYGLVLLVIVEFTDEHMWLMHFWLKKLSRARKEQSSPSSKSLHVIEEMKFFEILAVKETLRT